MHNYARANILLINAIIVAGTGEGARGRRS